MKIRCLYALVLLALCTLFSCDKEKKPATTPAASTTVSIGGKEYPIVKIGAQSWTGASYSGAGGAYFNENAPKTEYGKLYTYAEATAVTPPAGWHLPTREEYLTLLQTLGITVTDDRSANAEEIKQLQSVTGWSAGHKGTNASQFNAFPAGYFDNGIFNAEGDVVLFWTASKTAENNPYFLSISKGELQFHNAAATTQRFSVRFVKNN